MNNIFRILKISKPLYPIMAVLGILIIISSSLGLVLPIISKFAVDEISAKLNNQGGSIDNIYKYIAIGLILSVLGVLISSISDRIGDYFGGRLRKFLTEKFYDKILTLPQTYFDSEISGKILNQLNRGIASIQSFMNTCTNFILPTLFQAVLTIILLAKYSIILSFTIALLFPVYIVISYFSSKRWMKHEIKKNAIEDVSRGRIQESVMNMKLVKSSTNELTEYNNLSKALYESNKIYDVQSSEYHVFDFLRNICLTIAITIISFIVFKNAFNGLITFGDLVLIIQLVNQARIPLFGMSFIIGQIQMAEADSKEYFDTLKLTSTEDYRVENSRDRIVNPTIRFEDVSFKYDSSELVLNKINFEIKNNELVALVGPSGAGKSTLVNLILKFYDPIEGNIYLNNENYKDLNHKFIRDNISLVFQENELFSSTIKENVMYGMKATDEEVIQALKLANAYDFVQKLKDGINSEIGERGVRLSGGQKQRIQIARAILKNAPILILDEATSNLDAKSEVEVHEAIDRLVKNKLVLIIAHRFSTLQNASKIIVLNDKQIEDIGTPVELAKKQGIYSELLHYQVEGNKKLLKKFEIY